MLSRKKPAVGPGSGNTVSSAKESKKKRKLPKLEDFLQMRDYTGAITLAEVMGIRSINFKYENFRVFPWQYGGMKSEQGRSIFTHKPSHPLPLLMKMIVFFFPTEDKYFFR